jgi:KEOPS complex subunit Pcc1
LPTEFGVAKVKTKATIYLKFPSEKQLGIVLHSLKPEAERPATARSRTRLKKENRSLILSVEATDTIALRASLNAYLRWINSILDVFDVLKTQQN